MCEHIYLLVFSIKIWKIAENSIVWVTEVENEKIRHRFRVSIGGLRVLATGHACVYESTFYNC